MTTTKTIQSIQIGPERIDTGGPFVYHDPFGGIPQRKEHYFPDKPAHHLTRPTFWSWWQCQRCGFKTQTVNDLRKNRGCNMFANADTDKTDWRFDFEDLYDSPHYKPRYLNIKEEPWKGCNIHDRSEWVRYPETGQAIQEDKFINEQVKEEMKKYASIRR